MLEIKKIIPHPQEVESTITVLHKKLEFEMSDESNFSVILDYQEEVFIDDGPDSGERNLIKVRLGQDIEVFESDEENYDFWLKLNEGIDDFLKGLYPKAPVSERNKIAETVYNKIETVLQEERIFTKS